MDEVWFRVITIIAGASLGSGGVVWGIVLRRTDRKDARDQLTLGLGYGALVTLGMDYLKRGSITTGEFNDYRKLLYEPYRRLGGNGSAERLMRMIEELPFGPHHKHPGIFPSPEERTITDVRTEAAVGQDAHSG